MSQALARSTDDAGPPPGRGAAMPFLLRVLLVLLMVRFVYAATLELVPDEAFYWTWTRHLAAGYLDHPPMIALLMWIGTHVAGNNELGVRGIGAILSIATIAIIVRIGRPILRNETAAFWLAIIWLTSPLLTLTGLIATPDMPALFFSTCGLAFAIRIADARDHKDEDARAGRRWLWFGLFTGLALASKYTAILLPAGVVLALISSRPGRDQFRGGWVYLSALVALAVFWPVIAWNARHQWASFAFQLRHGASDYGAAPEPARSNPALAIQLFKDLGLYVGGQVAVWTPILFGIALLVLARFWRRVGQLGEVDRLLLWTGTLPLAFFLAACLASHHTEVNWPAFAYVPISLLTCRWMAEPGASARRRDWIKGGCELAGGITVALHVLALPPVTRWIIARPIHVPHMLTDLTGHRQAGRMVAQWSAAAFAPVVTNHHQDAGELAFYMPGQPDVWCVGIGARPTAFDFFDEPWNFAKIPRVLWVGRHVELFARRYGYRSVAREQGMLFLAPGRTRDVNAWLLEQPAPTSPAPVKPPTITATTTPTTEPH